MPEMIAREQAALLYRYGPGSVGISAIASCFLATLPDPFASRMWLLIWLSVMLLILLARATDILVRRWSRGLLGRDGRGDLCRFAVGVLLTAVMWGAFPILFFHSMSQLDRTYTATILSGMAGGSATVLSPFKHVAWVYCAAVLLPASIMFLAEGGQANISLGTLGIIFFAVMVLSSRLSHRTILDTIRTGRQLDVANLRLRNEVEEHRATEARLRQAQKLEAIGQLTAGVAHDFNNLLMSIGANAEFLIRNLSPSGGHVKHLASILRVTEKGGRLTRQLLAFARKEILQPQYIDINSIIRSNDNFIARTLGGTIRVEFRLAENLWETFIDPDQITQVVLNLIINAKDAMQSGGILTICTMNIAQNAPGRPHDLTAEEYVLLAVADTGTGMAEEILDHAFEPFFTTKPIGQGSGLGLSQVHGIVQQSGGITTIQSELGCGTVVTIYLPRVLFNRKAQHTIQHPDKEMRSTQSV